MLGLDSTIGTHNLYVPFSWFGTEIYYIHRSILQWQRLTICIRLNWQPTTSDNLVPT